MAQRMYYYGKSAKTPVAEYKRTLASIKNGLELRNSFGFGDTLKPQVRRSVVNGTPSRTQESMRELKKSSQGRTPSMSSKASMSAKSGRPTSSYYRVSK